MTDWIQFWKNEKVTNIPVSQANMDIFIKKTKGILNFNTEDVVLDIGCGLGYLESGIKNKVKEIHGIDISDRYLSNGNNLFKNEDHVHFHKLDEHNYTDLMFLESIKFTKVICLSVIQYYRHIGEIENLILSIQNISDRPAKLLIADIPQKRNIYIETIDIIKQSLKSGVFVESLKHLIKLRTSDYYHTRTEKGLITLDQNQLELMVQKLNLQADILSDQITINKNRLHLLVHF